jgi:hypothetical protein
MPYGTVNADVIGTSVTGSNLGAGNASLMKNRIINGSMTIDQINAGASVTPTTSNNVYPLDRWQTFASQASKYTAQQNAGSVTPPAGFVNYMGFTSSSAYSVGATDFFFVGQKIEGFNTADLGWGTANAKTVTLSFWVRSSLTGTFAGDFRNNDGGRNYPFNYTISSANTWEQKTITVAGDTSGTWLTTNGTGIEIDFSLGIGSTYSGTANAWTSSDVRSVTGATSVVGTSGATFYITGVQLEVGSSATGFEYVNYQTSLANCQRYYVVKTTTDQQTGAGLWTSSTNVISNMALPVTMRTAPSLTNNSATVTCYAGGADAGATTIVFNTVGATSYELYMTYGVATGTAGQGTSTRITAGSLTFSAEL